MSGLIIWLCTIPYEFVKHDMESASSGMINLIQLFASADMSLGCYVLTVWEAKGEGLHWNNLGIDILG